MNLLEILTKSPNFVFEIPKLLYFCYRDIIISVRLHENVFVVVFSRLQAILSRIVLVRIHKSAKV